MSRQNKKITHETLENEYNAHLGQKDDKNNKQDNNQILSLNSKPPSNNKNLESQEQLNDNNNPEEENEDDIIEGFIIPDKNEQSKNKNIQTSEKIYNHNLKDALKNNFIADEKFHQSDSESEVESEKIVKIVKEYIQLYVTEDKLNKRVIIPPKYFFKSVKEEFYVESTEINNDLLKLTNEQIIRKLKNNKNYPKQAYINLEEITKNYKEISKISYLERNSLLDYDDYETMRKLYLYTQYEHLRIENKQDDLKPHKYSYFCTNLGWFCCCSSKNNKVKDKKSKEIHKKYGFYNKSDIKDMGVGPIVYFKFLKLMIICFLAISILNIPLMLFYHSNYPYKTVTSLSDFLFKITIGNLGSNTYMCESFDPEPIMNSSFFNYTFDCIGDSIRTVKVFGISKSPKQENNNKLRCYNYADENFVEVDDKCDMTTLIQDELNTELQSKECKEDPTKCNVLLIIPESKCRTNYNNTEEDLKLYLTYSCYSTYIELTKTKLLIKRTNSGYLVVTFDILTFLIFIIFFYIFTRYKEEELQQYKEKSNDLKDYTLELSGIFWNHKNVLYELDNLLNHLRKVYYCYDQFKSGNFLKFSEGIKTKDYKFDDFSKSIGQHFNPKNLLIIDIAYPRMSSNKIEHILEYNKLLEDKRPIVEEIDEKIKILNAQPGYKNKEVLKIKDENVLGDDHGVEIINNENNDNASIKQNETINDINNNNNNDEEEEIPIPKDIPSKNSFVNSESSLGDIEMDKIVKEDNIAKEEEKHTKDTKDKSPVAKEKLDMQTETSQKLTNQTNDKERSDIDSQLNGNITAKKSKSKSSRKIQLTDLEIKETEKKLKDLQKKLKKLNSDILFTKQKIELTNVIEPINEIYIIFRNHKIANFFYSLYNVNYIDRFLMKLFGQDKPIKHLYYKNSEWLNFNFAKDDPTGIKWENLSYNKWKRLGWKMASIGLSLILVIITLIIILIYKYYEVSLANYYNSNADCYNIYSDDLEEIKKEYYSNNHEKKLKTYCFCYNMLTEDYMKSSEVKNYEYDGIKPCKYFVEKYENAYTLKILIIVFIPVINSSIEFIFKILTTYIEKNRKLSDDYSMNLIRSFIINLLNSIILLITMTMKPVTISKTSKFIPFNHGTFTDLNPDWFHEIGVIVTGILTVSIFASHLPRIIYMIVIKIRRLIDSGFDEGFISKAKTKKDYENLYLSPTFDLDIRYGNILGNLYLTLIFAGGIPILYAIFCIYLFFYFIIDKFLIIYFYRRPPKTDLSLTKVFTILVYVGLVLHLFMSVWIYGNPLLIYDTINENIDGTIGDKIRDRICVLQNIVLLFGYSIIFLIRNFTFFCFFCNCCGCCCCFKTKKNYLIDIADYDFKNDVVRADLEFGLALPVKKLYELYNLKKMQFFLCFKDSIDLTNSMNYQTHLWLSYNYLKYFLAYKIWKIKKEYLKKELKCKDEEYFLNHLEEFLNNNKNNSLFDFKHEVKNNTIYGIQSYNIIFHPEFRSVCYYDYLREIQATDN